MGVFSLKYRFPILCLILFVLMVFQTINEQWGGDLWEHAAVVRELAAHPFSPKHPILLLDAPHEFYSPYALGVALIARITQLDSVTTLSVIGIVNLAFFLFRLRLFVSLLFPENREATSFLCSAVHPFSLGEGPLAVEWVLQPGVSRFLVLTGKAKARHS